MKRNNFWTKISSFLMAVCILLGTSFSIPAYAKEEPADFCEDGLTLIATGKPVDGIIDIDTSILMVTDDSNEVPYAVAKPMGTFTCYGDNMTPMKHLVNDNRIHRLVVKVEFKKSIEDKGKGDIRLDMYIRRANTTQNIYMGMQSGTDISSSTIVASTLQTNWVSASPGENFQLFFDVCSRYASDATGVERVADIVQYWIYCD